MTTQGRDPLGKRALFSGADSGADSGAENAPQQPTPPRGPLDVTVACASCHVKTTLAAPEIVLRHLPVVAWLPWRKQSLLMRCPVCNRLAWHVVSRSRR